jgi:hypothetical protein
MFEDQVPWSAKDRLLSGDSEFLKMTAPEAAYATFTLASRAYLTEIERVRTGRAISAAMRALSGYP